MTATPPRPTPERLAEIRRLNSEGRMLTGGVLRNHVTYLLAEIDWLRYQLVAMEHDLAASAADLDALREALEQIHCDEGQVCPAFGECEHVACRSSHAAWMLADAALTLTSKEARP